MTSYEKWHLVGPDLGLNLFSLGGCLFAGLLNVNPYKPSVLFVGHGQKDPDQTPQNVATDWGLHCVLIECTFKILMKYKLPSQQPLNSK